MTLLVEEKRANAKKEKLDKKRSKLSKEEANLYTLLKLNPYAKTARRMALLAEEKRVNAKKGEAVQCRGEAESFGAGASVLGVKQSKRSDSGVFTRCAATEHRAEGDRWRRRREGEGV